MVALAVLAAAGLAIRCAVPQQWSGLPRAGAAPLPMATLAGTPLTGTPLTGTPLTGTLGGPIAKLAPPPSTNKTGEKPAVGLPARSVPQFSRAPSREPLEAAGPGAASRLIRVGLSTRGGPISFWSAGPLALSDPGQPAHKLMLPHPDWVTFAFGPTQNLEEGSHSFQGEITVTCGPSKSVGWSAVDIAVAKQPARVTSDGTDPRWGRPYRGQFEVGPQRALDEHHRLGALSVVNVVPLEEYLMGVVPWEMGPSAPLEALKAQAICARTKTLSLATSGHYASGGFDVCDYDACQGYPGAENESMATTKAVEATRGMALFYAGHPIDAVYSTNSGGITAAASDVWPHSEPYLHSVVDFASGSPFGASSKADRTEADWFNYCTTPLVSFALPAEAQRTQLAARRSRSPRTAALFGPDDWPEFYRWKRFFTEDEVNAAFAAHGVSQVTGFRIDDRALSGHIKRLTVTGFAAPGHVVESASRRRSGRSQSARITNAGLTQPGPLSAVPVPGPPTVAPIPVNVDVDGDANIRAMFSHQLGSTTALPSSTFVVTPRTDATGRLSGWLLQGAGWGHGAGMCQRGAQNHALEGWDARQIVNWYYHDVKLENLSP